VLSYELPVVLQTKTGANELQLRGWIWEKVVSNHNSRADGGLCGRMGIDHHRGFNARPCHRRAARTHPASHARFAYGPNDVCFTWEHRFCTCRRAQSRTPVESGSNEVSSVSRCPVKSVAAQGSPEYRRIYAQPVLPGKECDCQPELTASQRAASREAPGAVHRPVGHAARDILDLGLGRAVVTALFWG